MNRWGHGFALWLINAFGGAYLYFSIAIAPQLLSSTAATLATFPFFSVSVYSTLQLADLNVADFRVFYVWRDCRGACNL